MRRRARASWLFSLGLCLPLWSAGNADLAQVQIVYLLPMGSGLDQYLANRLIGEQVFQVVTDHVKADALLTDHIGANFEARFLELYPPPPDPEEAKVKAKEEEAKSEEPAGGGFGELKGDTAPMRSSIYRSRGNLFLVDVRTRRVLWSIYERPKSSAPDDLDKASRRIVDRLKKAVQGK